MQKRVNQNSRLNLIAASIALLSLLVGLILSLLWSEGALTSSEGAWDVLENALITLMGEYPDKPKTIAGQVLQLLLLIFGTFAFGAIVGKISSVFVTRALRQEKAVKQFNDHIIICNWNEKAPTIVRQLLEANQEHPRDIVVISASVIDDRNEFDDRSDVHFIQADPTHHATLENLQACQAKAVILLADEASEGPDEKNALIALAIKHLEQIPGQKKDIHVVGELVKLGRRRHLREAGVDEVISARDYSSGIIAQSAVFKNMSVVYQQLLTYSDETNEFYFIEPGKYPTSLHGKTFAELTQWISQYSAAHADNPLLLVGIKSGQGEIWLNPKQEHFDRLEDTDSLIVMAFRHVERIV
ncbi:potassium channel family protein [Thermocoleostomius sinensis]|uniref:NAD-binding protein n=1 Tax=Thermocoleostomius sinensis A174 TaxID=2016057 RepID=A0A9E8ZCP0_9CYAN|nr:NAD-binding protein [Thermocoleostomius sinensis]WAL60718.1 NAD-binding protein [Thermocoleostomius sinensis A174]